MTLATPARYRRTLGPLLILVALAVVAFGGRALIGAGSGVRSPGFGVRSPGSEVAPSTSTHAAQPHEGETGEAADHDGWGSTIAKAFNFAALVALLAYFLKGPIVGYLRARSDTIRKDLVEAASLRTQAERQLAEVRERLARLPAEIEALQRRGQEELAQERIRLAEATARERARVVERTRREIDLQFRVARRELLEHAAELSMRLARTRIEREITSADQARLIERYAAEVRP